jgi:hypothetical protein
MASCWSDDETLWLISLWSEDRIQAMLEGSRKNRKVFETIAREMGSAGYHRSPDQCSAKIKKLKFDYRRIKDRHNKTGEGKITWKFWEAMDSVLGHKPATKPPVLVESEQTEPEPEEVPEDANEESTPCCSNSSGRSSRCETPATNDDCEACSDEMASKRLQKSRKRTLPRNSRHEAKKEKLEIVLERMVAMQEESEKRSLMLEEKL